MSKKKQSHKRLTNAELQANMTGLNKRLAELESIYKDYNKALKIQAELLNKQGKKIMELEDENLEMRTRLEVNNDLIKSRTVDKPEPVKMWKSPLRPGQVTIDHTPKAPVIHYYRRR